MKPSIGADTGRDRAVLALHQCPACRRRYAGFAMRFLIDVLTWIGLAVVALAVVGMVVVGVLAWLLNLPIDDEPAQRARRC